MLLPVFLAIFRNHHTMGKTAPSVKATSTPTTTTTPTTERETDDDDDDEENAANESGQRQLQQSFASSSSSSLSYQYSNNNNTLIRWGDQRFRPSCSENRALQLRFAALHWRSQRQTLNRTALTAERGQQTSCSFVVRFIFRHRRSLSGALGLTRPVRNLLNSVESTLAAACTTMAD